jgi:hypothetical protein
MGFAVELYFDAATDSHIRNLWARIAAANLSSLLPDIGARPHISLACFDQLDPESLRADLENFAISRTNIEVYLSAVATFPTAEGAVYLSPASSLSLLEAHREFHQRLRSL